MDEIFVQIAAYRDPELVPTLRSCLMTAKYPQRLVFAICWQHAAGDKWDNLEEFRHDCRFKIIDIPHTESRGTCWARNLVQQQYNNERFTLQIDSHHRFVKNWDEELILMMKQLQNDGYGKPLITTYAPFYDASSGRRWTGESTFLIGFDKFDEDGVVLLTPFYVDPDSRPTSPVPAKFYSAHYCFTLGEFSQKVPHDPHYYFLGEEISISARAYTHGFDLFHPHKCLIFHEYSRKGRNKHWEDNVYSWQLNQASLKRNRILFGMEEGDIDFGIYGFGRVRSLKDYEAYSGIDFKNRTYSEDRALHSFWNRLPVLER